MHLGRLFQRSVKQYPDRPALALGRSPKATYSELDQQVRALAFWMRNELKLEAGDRVTVVMKNRIEYVHAFLAAWHAGLCVVPVNHKLHPTEIDYILRDSGSRLCLTDNSHYAALQGVSEAMGTLYLGNVDTEAYAHALNGPQASENVEAEQNGNQPAWLFYTSGTTGRPKGVVLTHANLTQMALNFYADVQPVLPTDSLLHAAPMSHGSGLYSIPCFIQGAQQIVPPSGGFDEAETCSLLEQHQQVTLFAAPTIVQRLARHASNHDLALAGLKTVVVAGAPFYVEDIKEAVRVLGPRIAQIYGQGESPMSITAQTSQQIADAVAQNDDHFLGSVGRAQTSIEITIEDGAGHALGVNEIGEIMVDGPTIMQGYWNNAEATRATLVSGKLHTGDIGLIDERGLLHLKDRSKDVIISGGTNIYPREVEETLMQHPLVAEVSVIGVPDPEWGESVLAFIVPATPATRIDPKELDAYCLDHMARFKRPKHYLFIEQLPKNATGKVLKRTLHQLYENDSGLPTPRP